MMLSIEKIENILKEVNADIKEWKYVSENPYRRPFAVETEYSIANKLSGKVHVRLDDSSIYVLVISKDVFNWKDRTKDLKLKGEIIDAAGGLMWIKENDAEALKEDIFYLLNYVSDISNKK